MYSPNDPADHISIEAHENKMKFYHQRDAEQREVIDEQVEENRGLRDDVLLMQKANAEQREEIRLLGEQVHAANKELLMRDREIAQLKKLTSRAFPIIPDRENKVKPHPLGIPWSIAELAYSKYAGRFGCSQSLQRLAERGGFHAGEMDEFVPDWREQCSQIAHQEQEITRLRDERDELKYRLQAWIDAEADHKALTQEPT